MTCICKVFGFNIGLHSLRLFPFQVSVETDPEWNRFGCSEQKLKLQKLPDILVSTVSKMVTLH